MTTDSCGRSTLYVRTRLMSAALAVSSGLIFMAGSSTCAGRMKTRASLRQMEFCSLILLIHSRRRALNMP